LNGDLCERAAAVKPTREHERSVVELEAHAVWYAGQPERACHARSHRLIVQCAPKDYERRFFGLCVELREQLRAGNDCGRGFRLDNVNRICAVPRALARKRLSVFAYHYRHEPRSRFLRNVAQAAEQLAMHL
jgi:hypothetical protein